MGQQTGVVLAGFVALHVALVLNIVSVATNNWLNGPTYNTTTNNNTNSSNTTSKGLWKKCEHDDCYSIMGMEQPAWFHAVQGLFLCGVILNFTSLFQDYIFLLVDRCKKNRLMHGSVTFDAVLGGCCLFCAVVIFGVLAPDNMDDMLQPRSLAWSFWIGVVGLVAMGFAVLLQFREGCLLRQHTPAYHDI